jgi:hypothetical protein
LREREREITQELKGRLGPNPSLPGEAGGPYDCELKEFTKVREAWSAAASPLRKAKREVNSAFRNTLDSLEAGEARTAETLSQLRGMQSLDPRVQEYRQAR